MKKVTVRLTVLAIGLLSLAAWLLLRREPPVTVPDGARAGEVILAACTVRSGGVRRDADCGTLVVPEIRRDPKVRLIALPVTRIHASAANPAEPIFYLAGGPGHSNMTFRPPAWLLTDHDVVMVGYRGVDGTPKLDCPEVADAMSAGSGDLLGPASLDSLGAAMQRCAVRLQTGGVDLDGYSIPEVVEDMEAARKALGYERIDLLSESYGTRVAQVYATMHPTSLLRSAMIGVNPPGHFLWQPDVVDAQVAYYADLWKRTGDPAAPDIAAVMRRVNTDMPRRWLFLPIDQGKVKILSFAMLFHRTTAPIVFDAYLAADEGDLGGLAFMSLAFDFVMPKLMTWGEFFAVGGSADFEPGRNYRSELVAPGATLGAPMSLLIWGSADGWPVTPIADEYREVHPTDVETLLVSGSIDFSTPAQFAEAELLPSLRNGRHVVIAEQGHVGDFWAFQGAAAERLLTSFFATGQADDSLYETLPMDFRPTVRLPVVAKVVSITGILLAGILVWAAWTIARRRRRA